MFKKWVSTGIVFFVVVVSLAQNQMDTTCILTEVVVRGNLYREVIPSQRLSGEKLEALSSFSVADAVRYFSGVQIKDYGGVGGMKTMDVRSMGSNHLGVFYDGIEIGNAQNGMVDLGKFSLDFVEEISLYNGQKSQIFQSAKDFASAGSLYLRTRRPRFEENKKTNLVVYFRTGSFALANPSLLWEQKISQNISSSVNAEFIYSSGRYKYRYRQYNTDGTIAHDTSAIRENGDIRSLRVEGGFNGYFPQGSWAIKGYFYHSERGLPGAIVNNVWKNAQRQWDRNGFVQGSFQYQLFNGYDFLLNAKYSNDYMRYKNPDTTLMLIDNQFWQQEMYLSTANKYSIFHNWDINLSVDYIWNTLDATLARFVKPSRNTLLVALASAFDWRRFKIQASVLGTFVFDHLARQDAAKTSDKAECTPAVFLSYQPLKKENLNIRAFYKHIFRMPTFNDLYYTDIGNIHLRPELTKQYNLGIQYDKYFTKGVVAYFNISVDGYYNHVKDKIVAIPKGGSGGGSLYRWQMMNLGWVDIKGVDLSLKAEWKLPANIRIHTHLNYTFQQAQDLTDKSSPWYGGQIAYVPWHSGSAIVNALWRTWDLNYSFIYVGERYHNSANIAQNYERPWYTHDLTLGKSFHLQKVRFKISAQLNNLLNQAYEVINCYPMPGINYKLILKLEI